MKIYFAFGNIQCAVDRSFLGNVKDAFGGFGITPEMILLILGTVVVLVVVAVTVIVLNRFFIRRDTQEVPADWIVRKSEIVSTFNAVLAQRSKIEMSFYREGQKSKPTSCSLEEVKANSLMLGGSGFLRVDKDWIGRRVECFFKLVNPKDTTQMRFHTFTSDILGIKKMSHGSIQLTLNLPEKIVLRQKRGHFRMEPPSQYLMGVAVWPESPDKPGKPESHLKKWGRPRLTHVAGARRTFRVVNFSAGGLRLEVPSALAKEIEMSFEIDEKYILLIDLYEPKDQKRIRFWLFAVVRNRYEEFESKKLETGLQFTAAGTRLKDSKDQIKWTEVADKGVVRLENWLVKRHLELFREKGIS